MDNGRIIGAMAVQQQQMEMMIQAEIRATARELFVKLAGPYVGGDSPNAHELRRLSSLAWKTAQYVYVGAGIVNVDDEALWGKPG